MATHGVSFREDETGPGTSASRQGSMESYDYYQQQPDDGPKTVLHEMHQYSLLRERNMPLDTMKLFPNEDFSALDEDAGHVFNLNERLSRYALYVSQLEGNNRSMITQIETLSAQVVVVRQENDDLKKASEAERVALLAKEAAAAALQVDTASKLDAALKEIGRLKSELERERETCKLAESRALVLDSAGDDLRKLARKNNVDVPKDLTKAALIGKAVGKGHSAAAERMLDAAIANADSARLAIRVAALHDRGFDPPVDEVRDALACRGPLSPPPGLARPRASPALAACPLPPLLHHTPSAARCQPPPHAPPTAPHPCRSPCLLSPACRPSRRRRPSPPTAAAVCARPRPVCDGGDALVEPHPR